MFKNYFDAVSMQIRGGAIRDYAFTSGGQPLLFCGRKSTIVYTAIFAFIQMQFDQFENISELNDLAPRATNALL